MKPFKDKYSHIYIDLESIRQVKLDNGQIFLYKIKNNPKLTKNEIKNYVYEKVIKSFFNNKAKIKNRKSGEPLIVGVNNKFISISHSKNYFAFYISNFSKIGVDIEMNRDIPIAGYSYFMNEDELSNKWSKNEVLSIWCAKEAFIKLNKGKVKDWKEALTVKEISKNQITAFAFGKKIIFAKIQTNIYTFVYSLTIL